MHAVRVPRRLIRQPGTSSPCNNALSGRGPPRIRARWPATDTLEPLASAGRVHRLANPRALKLASGVERIEKKNEPAFDVASHLAAAAFIQVFGRVAAQTFSFWSRPVAVFE